MGIGLIRVQRLVAKLCLVITFEVDCCLILPLSFIEKLGYVFTWRFFYIFLSKSLGELGLGDSSVSEHQSMPRGSLNAYRGTYRLFTMKVLTSTAGIEPTPL